MPKDITPHYSNIFQKRANSRNAHNIRLLVQIDELLGMKFIIRITIHVTI